MDLNSIIRIVLPVYFLVYFGLVFIGKSIQVAKKTKVNPFVIPKDDSVQGLIGMYFKLINISIFCYALAFTIKPGFFIKHFELSLVNTSIVKVLGLILFIISLIWILIAQSNMKNSWRIGLDENNKTELINTGLFKISRNPVFLGMIVSLIGLFLVTPNLFSLVFLLLSYVLIQIQIRLEEAFLEKEHGTQYLEYKTKVRRLI